MNRLSWLIYLADVCNNLDWLFFLFMFIGVAGLIISVLVWMNDGNNEWKPEQRRRTIFHLFLPLAVTGSILGAIVPSDDTIYAIAASELGERVLNSQTGGKAVQALNHWLDKQMGTESEPTTNSN